MAARGATRWVVVLAMMSAGHGCGAPEPGPSGATEGDASTGATTGTGADTSAGDGSTTSMLPDVGPPRPSQTASCSAWVTCATELAVPELEEIEAAYGIGGSCWGGDAAQAVACDGACTEALAATVMELEAMGQDVPEVCDPPRMVSWAEVEMIIDAHCVTACHEPGGEDASLDLSDGAYYALYGVASSQSLLSLVKAGSHQESYLWHKVNGSQGSVGGSGSRMPRGAEPLAPEQIEAIADWIDGGAQNF
jgi:hypothetical protein